MVCLHEVYGQNWITLLHVQKQQSYWDVWYKCKVDVSSLTMVQLIQLYDDLIQATVHCKINRQNSGIIITCMHTQSKNWWKGKAHLSWNKWSKL